jgi:hypothetical protein
LGERNRELSVRSGGPPVRMVEKTVRAVQCTGEYMPTDRLVPGTTLTESAFERSSRAMCAGMVDQ